MFLVDVWLCEHIFDQQSMPFRFFTYQIHILHPCVAQVPALLSQQDVHLRTFGAMLDQSISRNVSQHVPRVWLFWSLLSSSRTEEIWFAPWVCDDVWWFSCCSTFCALCVNEDWLLLPLADGNSDLPSLAELWRPFLSFLACWWWQWWQWWRWWRWWWCWICCWWRFMSRQTSKQTWRKLPCPHWTEVNWYGSIIKAVDNRCHTKSSKLTPGLRLLTARIFNSAVMSKFVEGASGCGDGSRPFKAYCYHMTVGINIH